MITSFSSEGAGRLRSAAPVTFHGRDGNPSDAGVVSSVGLMLFRQQPGDSLVLGPVIANPPIDDGAYPEKPAHSIWFTLPLVNSRIGYTERRTGVQPDLPVGPPNSEQQPFVQADLMSAYVHPMGQAKL